MMGFKGGAAYLALLMGWLFLIIPILDVLHQKFSSRKKAPFPFVFHLINWFLLFWKSLEQTPPDNWKTSLAPYSLKGLIFLSLVFSCVAIALLPVASYLPFQLSLFFSLSILFLAGFTLLGIGFNFGNSLLSVEMFEQFISRQAALIVITAACFFTCQHPPKESHFAVIFKPPWDLISFSSWGAFENPLAFLAALMALSLYTKERLDSEFLVKGLLKPSLEGNLWGTTLVAFKVARNVECIAIYSLVVEIFLTTLQVKPVPADFLWFTIKLILLVVFSLKVSQSLPYMRNDRVWRVYLYILLPLSFFSFAFFISWHAFFN